VGVAEALTPTAIDGIVIGREGAEGVERKEGERITNKTTSRLHGCGCGWMWVWVGDGKETVNYVCPANAVMYIVK